MHQFRKLAVYQRALELTVRVRVLSKEFPKDERFVLSQQLCRAPDSVVLNIAEGAGNRSDKEFGKFLDYAIRSVHECVACFDIARSNQFLSDEQYQEHFWKADELIAMLVGFQRSLLKNLNHG